MSDTTEFIVDEGYASRASLAALRWPRPIGVLVYVYGPLVAIIGALQFASGGDGTALVVLGVLVSIASPLIIHLRSVALLRRQVPVGSTIRVAFEPSEFTVERPGSRLTQSYDQVKAARRLGGIVAYRNISGLTYVLPGTLVTEADLRRLGGPR